MTLRSIPKQLAAKITRQRFKQTYTVVWIDLFESVYCMFGRAYENNLLHGHTLISAYFYKLAMIVY